MLEVAAWGGWIIHVDKQASQTAPPSLFRLVPDQGEASSWVGVTPLDPIDAALRTTQHAVVGTRPSAIFGASSVVAILSAMCLAVSPVAVVPVAAHCPNTHVTPNVQDKAEMYVSAGADAVSAVIPWTDPNPCHESTYHGVSVLSTGLDWVQAGWFKTYGASVRGYCEFEGPISAFIELPHFRC